MPIVYGLRSLQAPADSERTARDDMVTPLGLQAATEKEAVGLHDRQDHPRLHIEHNH